MSVGAGVSRLVEPGQASEEGGNHGNLEAATTHQEAPSHWRTQWNTYQPHKAGTNPRAGGKGEKLRTGERDS